MKVEQTGHPEEETTRHDSEEVMYLFVTYRSHINNCKCGPLRSSDVIVQLCIVIIK